MQSSTQIDGISFIMPLPSKAIFFLCKAVLHPAARLFCKTQHCSGRGGLTLMAVVGSPVHIAQNSKRQNCNKRFYFSKYEETNIHKKWEKCWLSKINAVSTWNISRSFHRNIANHTIFSISFSSSFHWYYLYTHFRFSEKHFFCEYEGFDHNIFKMAAKMGFSMVEFCRAFLDPRLQREGPMNSVLSVRLSVRPSVCPSVTQSSQDWFISFFYFFAWS